MTNYSPSFRSSKREPFHAQSALLTLLARISMFWVRQAIRALQSPVSSLQSPVSSLQSPVSSFYFSSFGSFDEPQRMPLALPGAVTAKRLKNPSLTRKSQVWAGPPLLGRLQRRLSAISTVSLVRHLILWRRPDFRKALYRPPIPARLPQPPHTVRLLVDPSASLLLRHPADLLVSPRMRTHRVVLGPVNSWLLHRQRSCLVLQLSNEHLHRHRSHHPPHASPFDAAAAAKAEIRPDSHLRLGRARLCGQRIKVAQPVHLVALE
ncbi:hypothetical protein MBM_07501 [Drepanopeziza brunnea f. sp. 'multigermtubi' MB_m1]|uniref:Uncharacterized protein n=1 Tax=Marssonina brunnea f. sp. multigermtubi (strain MB_m1) TaxID=1072389 RepID=K1WN20_MARBU|nr:uncharacterized protein MBM_07501 [Drepanopeziza brunnea f. sp. 'multigermtubi' MB_m1]EKD14271.1 hypothetical protein MBM_07501 [Drepanopeziza brunnea f. sp. 'multigermtubi' MB_m1]